jgi:hypothetical protein
MTGMILLLLVPAAGILSLLGVSTAPSDRIDATNYRSNWFVDAHCCSIAGLGRLR